jgi:hypothetical protein
LDDCLKCLGFHYQFEADSAIADKVRQVLRADAAAEVRLTAASVLAGRSQWPDQALISALKEDPDRYVQQAAFEALLRLAGYSMLEVRQIVRGLQESGNALNWEEFRHVVANKGLQVPLE